MATTETLTATAGDVVRVERKCFDRNTEDQLTITGEVTEVDGVAVASDPAWITIHSVIDGVASGRKQGRLLMDVNVNGMQAEEVDTFTVRGTVTDHNFEPVEKDFTITVAEHDEVLVAHSSLGMLSVNVSRTSVERSTVSASIFADRATYSFTNDYIYYNASGTEIGRIRPDGTGQEVLIDLTTDVDGGDPHQYVLGITTDEQTGQIYITTRGGLDYRFPRLVRAEADGTGATVLYEWPEQEWRFDPFVDTWNDRLLVSSSSTVEIYELSTMTLTQSGAIGNVIAADTNHVYALATASGWPLPPALFVYDRTNLAAGPEKEINVWRRTQRDGGNHQIHGLGLIQGHLYTGQQDNQTAQGETRLMVINPVSGAGYETGEWFTEVWETASVARLPLQQHRSRLEATTLEDFESTSVGSLPSGWSQPAESRMTLVPASTWGVTTDDAYEGTQCLKSGGVSVGEVSTAQLDITVAQAGFLTLRARAVSDWKDNRLKIYVGGILEVEVTNSGTDAPNWSAYTVPIPAGTTELELNYHKTAADTTGVDAAFVDLLSFTPASDAMGHRGDHSRPDPPTNIAIDDTSGDRVITWTDPAGADKIVILRGFDGPEGPYQIRTTVEAGQETFTDGWSTSSDIWYRLYAEDATYDRSEETTPVHAPPVA